VPGNKITDQQALKYKTMRRQATQEIAAASMGSSVRSARRIQKADELPSQREARGWRTRADPLAGVWQAELGILMVDRAEAPAPLERRPTFDGFFQSFCAADARQYWFLPGFR
jgi:hypothetical protein